jgi:CRISPR/Cas system-associated endonuclease Cas1
VINRREIKADDFLRTEHGIRLTKAALTRFVGRSDARVRTPVFVPAIQGKTPYQRVFELQVRQLGRMLADEHLTYQPFQLQ